MKFVKSSFIPDRKINLALVDGRITNSMIKNLHDINVNIIKSEKCKEIPAGSRIWFGKVGNC